MAISCYPILCVLLLISTIRASSGCLTRDEITQKTDEFVKEIKTIRNNDDLNYNKFTNCVNSEESDLLADLAIDEIDCIDPKTLGDAIQDNCMQHIDSSERQSVLTAENSENIIVANQVLERHEAGSKHSDPSALRIMELISTIFSSRATNSPASRVVSQVDPPSNDISLLGKVTVRASCNSGGDSCDFVCCMLAASYGISKSTCQNEVC